ncbi:MAG: hypothetical protein DME06_19485 [Candidatus Rokuibacteriota bacterium]|nr:MAG: hypothetical protein DME06_19485 [Candidatus Rokubacteria bacterium]
MRPRLVASATSAPGSWPTTSDTGPPHPVYRCPGPQDRGRRCGGHVHEAPTLRGFTSGTVSTRMPTSRSPDEPAERVRLRRWILVVATGVFATTLAQPGVLRLPFQHILRSDLHVAPHEMAAFFAGAALAWYLKPLAGIVSDSFPLFGTRRRHYLVLSGTCAAALWLVVGFVPRTYASLLAAVIALNAALVMGSTVTGGLLVEAGQRYGATGRLTSVRYVVQNLCTLLGGPLGGLLAARSFEVTGLSGGRLRARSQPSRDPVRCGARSGFSGWSTRRRVLRPRSTISRPTPSTSLLSSSGCSPSSAAGSRSAGRPSTGSWSRTFASDAWCRSGSAATPLPRFATSSTGRTPRRSSSKHRRACSSRWQKCRS